MQSVRQQATVGDPAAPATLARKLKSATVWEALESTPGFNEQLERGKASLDAGHRVPFEAERKNR